MRRLPSWLQLPASGQAKKLHVKVKPLKLEGLCGRRLEENGKGIVVVIEMVWKGPKSTQFLPCLKRQRNFSSHRFLKKGEAIEWDEEFDNICSFLKKNNSFSSWNVKFKLLHGEDAKCRTKLKKMGYIHLNIAELASRKDSEIEKKLPVSLQIDGAPSQATLSIRVSFAEIRSCIDSPEISKNSFNSDKIRRIVTFSSKTIKIHEDEATPSSNSSDSANNGSITTTHQLGTCPSAVTGSDSGVKVKFFSWKKNKGVSFRLSRKKRESTENTNGEKEEYCVTREWEEKELISRCGQTKLKANVFFASFDQRSKTAEGDSACAALAAVIAHWLNSNQDFMPTTSEFDSLIKEGCSEWRKLCQDEAYMNCFPDNHFDLETVLKADLRPLNISHNKSFTGIFNPEKFEHLKGAKSFNDVWEEISSIAKDYDQRVYIVSWNDHFFVLKADADAYYIIDSLGERLFEGCNQAYILKFDDSCVMYRKVVEKEVSSEDITETEDAKEEDSEEIICRGKDCCREFIKRFLAAIPLRELEEEEKKGTVSTCYLLQRLQIDFHYCSSSSSSVSTSSPDSSLFSTDGSISPSPDAAQVSVHSI